MNYFISNVVNDENLFYEKFMNMKAIKQIIGLMTIVVALAACSKDNNESKEHLISFEAAESLMDVNGDVVVPCDAEVVYDGVVNHTPKNIYWPKTLAYDSAHIDEYDQIYWQGSYIFSADGLVSFGGYYNNGTRWGKIYDTWGGFTLSQNYDMTATAAKTSNQFSVWATSGAKDTKTFAVGYDSNSAGAGYMEPIKYNTPQIDFSRKVLPRRVFLANSAYVYPFFSGKPTDMLTVTVTGWNGQIEGKSVVCKLVDGATRVSGWVSVDLLSLGLVDKLTFKVGASDSTAPFYFCLDEIEFAE